MVKFNNAVIFEQFVEGVTRQPDPLSHDLKVIQLPEGVALLDWRAERQALPRGSSPLAVIVDGEFISLWEGQYFTLEEVEAAIQVQPVVRMQEIESEVAVLRAGGQDFPTLEAERAAEVLTDEYKNLRKQIDPPRQSRPPLFQDEE